VSYHLSLLLALAVTLTAAVSDWKTGKIPDALTLGMLVAAPIAHGALAYASDGTAMTAIQGASASMLGAIVAGVLPYLVLRAGGMGGGDVKLFLAVGAITGPGFAAHAVTYAMAVALIAGLTLIVRRDTIRPTYRNVLALLRRPMATRDGAQKATPMPMTTMRMAFSIFVGTCLASAVLWNPAR
jgi:prepilin peptidase CpaA